jgi:O-antigen/teichoic acid export membrane protein
MVMVTGRSTLQNAVSLTAGQIISVVAALITNIWLARVLGPEGLGLLGFGTAIVAYLVLGAALGSDLWGARLIASKKYAIPIITGRIFGLRIWAFCAVAILFFVALPFLAEDQGDRQILMVQAGGVLAIPLALDYFYQGVQRQFTSAARQSLQAILIMAISLVFVRSSDDLLPAAAAQMAGAILPAAIILIIAINRYPIGWPNFSAASLVKTFSRVSPFTVSAFVNTLFFSVDILMLGILTGNSETGLYVASSRLLLFALMPAGIIFGVAFPILAAATAEQRRQSLNVYALVLGLIAVAGTAVAFAMAPVIIELVYGPAFLPAVSIFGVQMVTVIVISGRMAPGAGLSAWGFQKDHARSTAIAAIVNIVLNGILIPLWGAMGAAVATLISQIALYLVFTYRLRRISGVMVVAKQFTALVCGVIAFGAVLGLGTLLSGIGYLAAGIMLSVIVTAAAARLLGLFRWPEIQALLRPPATE